jgi:hypothetical protein
MRAPSQAAYNAVRLGVYNMGTDGAYNAVVAGRQTSVESPPAIVAGTQLPPWATQPATQKIPVALIVTVAAVTIALVIAALLSLMR